LRGRIRALTTPILEEVTLLTRTRLFLFLFVGAGLAFVTPRLMGKGSPCDILFQSTTDVYGELAPCG